MIEWFRKLLALKIIAIYRRYIIKLLSRKYFKTNNPISNRIHRVQTQKQMHKILTIILFRSHE